MIVAVCILILATAAAFHFYWGFGGQIGASVSIPQREDGARLLEPGPLAAHAVGLILTGAALFVLATPRLSTSFPLLAPWARAGVVVLGLICLARGLSWHKYVGLFKSVRQTRFAWYDTWVYSPLCVILGLGLLALAFDA